MTRKIRDPHQVPDDIPSNPWVFRANEDYKTQMEARKFQYMAIIWYLPFSLPSTSRAGKLKVEDWDINIIPKPARFCRSCREAVTFAMDVIRSNLCCAMIWNGVLPGEAKELAEKEAEHWRSRLEQTGFADGILTAGVKMDSFHMLAVIKKVPCEQ
jgi:hypothetical protein